MDRIERRFKFDVRYLASGTFWGMVSQAATIASSLALSVVVSRYVPKGVYGEYKYILSLVSLLPILSLTGLGNAVLQSVARGFDGALVEAFKTNLRWSIAIFFGALAIALYYFSRGNDTFAIEVLVGGSLTPFITSASLASQFLVGKKDFARLAIYSGVVGSVVPSIALMVTAIYVPTPLALVCIYFISNVTADFFLYWYVVRVYRPDPSLKDSGTLSYAKHLSLIGIINGVAGSLDQILLFHFVGPAQLAVYNFAIGIPDQIKGPLKNLDSMLQARFANRLSGDIRDNMGTKMLFLFLFAVIAIALYIPLAPLFYRVLYPNYVEAIPYSQVYMLSFLSLIFSPIGSYLSARKLVREQYISSVGMSLLQILFMTLGTVYFGIWGLIWAIVVTRSLSGFSWYILYLYAADRGRPSNTIE